MIIEATTSLAPQAVLAAAKKFFARRSPIYGAFLERESSTYLSFRGQGGEEIVIGVEPIDGGTSVRASTYLFTQQASRFLSTLAPGAPPTAVETG
ncbi:MAG: hypothetical protein ABR543_02010 [Gemmatimonadaceae bacterium]